MRHRLELKKDIFIKILWLKVIEIHTSKLEKHTKLLLSY